MMEDTPYWREIKDIDALIEMLRKHKSDLKCQEKLLDKSYSGFRDRTPKQNDKLNCDLGWNKCAIIRNLHELHALAVNLGIADIRQKSAFETVVLHPDNWHKYPWNPPLPRGFSMEYFSEAAK